MKKIAFIMMVIFCLFSSVSVFAAEKWAMGCSGAGSGPYSSGAAVANYLNKNQNAIRFSAQATAGYNENVALVSGGEIQIGMQQTAGLLDAYTGKYAFKGHAHKRLRLLFPYTICVYHVVARKASNINTIDDLKGKKFNISLPSQTTRTMTSTSNVQTLT
jgi:TRAP transporter TAXI family solute receptor